MLAILKGFWDSEERARAHLAVKKEAVLTLSLISTEYDYKVKVQLVDGASYSSRLVGNVKEANDLLIKWTNAINGGPEC